MPASAMVAAVYPPRREGDETLVEVALLNGMSFTVKLYGREGARRIEAPTYTVQRMGYQNQSYYRKPVPSEILQCPKCGAGIEEWFYLEHVVAYRRILSASTGVVRILNAYNIEDSADILNAFNIVSSAKPPSFFCRECRTVIPIPEELTLEFAECEG